MPPHALLALDLEPGLFGSLLWPEGLVSSEKVARLRRLTPENRLLLVEGALREAAGRWGELPGWVLWPAVRRVLHDGDTPSEAYRWALRQMSEADARRRVRTPVDPVGPCFVWGSPPPMRLGWIPDTPVLEELRSHPGRWALVHVLSKRRAIEAASKVRTGKVSFWLPPGEWEASGAILEGRAHSGLWLRYNRRRGDADVQVERRADVQLKETG